MVRFPDNGVLLFEFPDNNLAALVKLAGDGLTLSGVPVASAQLWKSFDNCSVTTGTPSPSAVVEGHCEL